MIRGSYKAFLLASVCFCSLGGPYIKGAWAQPMPPDNQTDVNLSSVYVGALAGRAVREAGKLPATDTSHLSAAQLQALPPTETTDILAGIPGVYYQNDGTPGLSASIRGMQDFGRVAVNIDGARQDFAVGGHGASGSVFVDPLLLSGLDVTRGAVTESDGAGAIGGVVSLHTIDYEDLVKAGQKEGFKATVIGGTNGYDGAGMVAGAAQLSSHVNFVGAFSLRSSGDYKDGSWQTVPKTAQKLQSGLAKLNIRPDSSQTLQLEDIIYHNDFGNETEGVYSHSSLVTNTANAKYHLAPAENPWLDFHLQGAYTRTVLKTTTDPWYGFSLVPEDHQTVTLDTLSAQANNISRFDLGPVNTEVDYGADYSHDQVKTTSSSGHNGETPKGVRQLAGLFTNAHFFWNLFELTTGARVEHYNLSGSGINTFAGIPGGLSIGPFDIHKNATGFSPKVTLAADILPGWQVYGSYALGYRPPSTNEALTNGTHPGLSFINFVPNPNLSPETSHGWEAGTKLAYHDVLAMNDKLTLSTDYFYTKIRNYIDQTYVMTFGASPIPDYGYYYANLRGITVSQGLEAEGDYEANYGFAHISYSNILTKLPADGGGGQIYTAPPRNVFTATFGLKLFDQKLVFGERTRAASKTQNQGNMSAYTSQYVQGYVVEDVFANYQVTSKVRLFSTVDNIGNKKYYSDGLASIASPGITAKFGMTVLTN